ncbi:hypothetical protein CGLO_00059 [Colletotrichum gloeosporioides Cg-14]|uniref:Uncharacterized protein n=1 Tax=Colletotrichum gloeosporioides (strain Cg-14) TaxID=1237896 RepID=T0MEM0_COLGC|nr:hypothetical protein CGLO_00059 [Colletotrichum gloeosporioides Cg-14]
MLSLLGIS